MGLQAAVHLGHMPWALTKEEEEEAAADRDVGLQTNLQSQKKNTKFNNEILGLIGSKFHYEIIHSVCLS
jgi:hypothetical protein